MAKRVAMRENGTLYWLISDHLGSTAKVANGSTLTGELRYKAWGETRYTWGTTPTTVRFTGQREESTIGLYFYNARFYDPALGRFTQPDTIVPNPGNPQDLNRYAYTRNNPLRYTDPTGHCLNEDGETVCDFQAMRAVRIMSHPLYQTASMSLAKMIYLEQNTETQEVQVASGHVARNDAEQKQGDLLANLISVLNTRKFQACKGSCISVALPEKVNLMVWKTIQDKIIPDILAWGGRDTTNGAIYFANIDPDQGNIYADKLARMVQEDNPGLSRDQALFEAGYGFLRPEQSHQKLFVYNRYEPVPLNGYQVANPQAPLTVTPAQWVPTYGQVGEPLP